MHTQMTDVNEVVTFLLAGKAKFTLVSPKTGNRFTYRVTATDRGDAWFASVLSGTNNETDYTYMGLIDKDKKLRTTRASRVSPGATSWIALQFTLDQLMAGRLPIEFWHEGCCCRCGRTLTVPESIENGIGPECAKKMGGRLGTLEEGLAA